MQEDFENIKNKESNGSKNTAEENSLKSGFTAVEESSDQPVERERERETGGSSSNGGCGCTGSRDIWSNHPH